MYSCSETNIIQSCGYKSIIKRVTIIVVQKYGPRPHNMNEISIFPATAWRHSSRTNKGKRIILDAVVFVQLI